MARRRTRARQRLLYLTDRRASALASRNRGAPWSVGSKRDLLTFPGTLGCDHPLHAGFRLVANEGLGSGDLIPVGIPSCNGARATGRVDAGALRGGNRIRCELPPVESLHPFSRKSWLDSVKNHGQFRHDQTRGAPDMIAPNRKVWCTKTHAMTFDFMRTSSCRVA